MSESGIGAHLRTVAAETGWCVVKDGALFVRLTRHGNDWALELNDETPVTEAATLAWATAAGVPPHAQWLTTAQGKIWRCEWQGTEDAAPDGPRATWLGAQP